MVRLLSVALIGRDKFSTVVASLDALLADLPPNSDVKIFDPGYPPSILDKIRSLSRLSCHPISIFPTTRFANTNYVWNQFVSVANGKYLLNLENDVIVQNGCIGDCIDAIETGFCDIAVPKVFEEFQSNVHYNPTVSEIIDVEGGGILSKLDRGRDAVVPIAGGRKVKHLERHCFIMSKTTAKRLGTLDEQMYCRTDYDMSFACHRSGIVIGIPPIASVTLSSKLNSEIDREFYEFRWDANRVALANRRLIDKWKLVGFKTTIHHVDEARARLMPSE